MKKISGYILLLAAACTLSFAQNSNGQGNDNQGYPAVPKGRGFIRPHVWILKSVGPNVQQAATTYMTPAMMTSAYGLNAVSGSGQGATVAIVDAYDAPNVASDLSTFMSTYSISCPTSGWGTFTKVNQNGSASPLPTYNSGWETETSLDTQWVRAIAPCASIVLVEANSNNFSDLMTAVTTAASLGSAVSMSWGSTEFSGESSFDTYFTRSGVTFLASSGDTGGIVEWPSASPYVIGVGGTDLNYSGSVLTSETGWSGSGGGCSTQESAIAPQTGFLPSSPGCSNRATPDVSMDGGGTSPVLVYISGQGGWYAVYGTSLSVQLWAGVVAIVNGLKGAPLNGTLADLYTNAAGIPSGAPYINNYRDITSGTAGTFTAGPGWDYVTGLGSPMAQSLVSALTGATTKTNTSTALTGPSSSTYGQQVTFTATVSPSAATGTVTFKDGSTTLSTVNLTSGAASYSTSALSVGNHSITATYSGDSNYNTSTSSAVSLTVSKANTTTTLTSSANPSSPGQQVTFTATVSPSAATGTVTFTDGTTTLGTVNLTSGAASYSTSTLTVGNHSIAATYSGDGNYNTSTSTTLTQTVNTVTKTNTSTLLTGPASSAFGQSVTFAATVSPAAATGTVTFKDGSTTLSTVTLSSGSASYSTSTLSVGNHSITAVYSGDSNYNTSTSGAVSLTVNKANTTTALTSSSNPSFSGQNVTFTATVSPSGATGTVTFKDGSTTLSTVSLSSGRASYTTSTLTVGSHSITATYSGDSNYNGSTSSTLTQTVNTKKHGKG